MADASLDAAADGSRPRRRSAVRYGLGSCGAASTSVRLGVADRPVPERRYPRSRLTPYDPVAYRRQDLDDVDCRLERVRCRLQLARVPLPRRPRSDSFHLRRSLVTVGMFIFSIEHPIYSFAPTHPESSPTNRQPHVSRSTIPDRETEDNDWLARRAKYHRTIGTYVSSLSACRLRSEHLCNGLPPPNDRPNNPNRAIELNAHSSCLVGAAASLHARRPDALAYHANNSSALAGFGMTMGDGLGIQDLSQRSRRRCPSTVISLAQR